MDKPNLKINDKVALKKDVKEFLFNDKKVLPRTVSGMATDPTIHPAIGYLIDGKFDVLYNRDDVLPLDEVLGYAEEIRNDVSLKVTLLRNSIKHHSQF